jgi:hypothetical protein
MDRHLPFYALSLLLLAGCSGTSDDVQTPCGTDASPDVTASADGAIDATHTAVDATSEAAVDATAVDATHDAASPDASDADLDAGADHDTHDARPDGDVAHDAAPDVTPGDGGWTTLSTCEKLGITCPAATPFCAAHYDATNNVMTSDCVASLDGGGGLGEYCQNTPLGGCQNGLVCAPQLGVGYRCSSLCSASIDCPADYPYCNDTMGWSPGLPTLGGCARCNPKSASECGFGKACRVRSITATPSCETAGVKKVGEACSGSTDCSAGLLCACGGGDAGTFGVGDDCGDAGVCRTPCASWSRGQTWDCPNNELCVGEGDGLYSYCR